MMKSNMRTKNQNVKFRVKEGAEFVTTNVSKGKKRGRKKKVRFTFVDLFCGIYTTMSSSVIAEPPSWANTSFASSIIVSACRKMIGTH